MSWPEIADVMFMSLSHVHKNDILSSLKSRMLRVTSHIWLSHEKKKSCHTDMLLVGFWMQHDLKKLMAQADIMGRSLPSHTLSVNAWYAETCVQQINTPSFWVTNKDIPWAKLLEIDFGSVDVRGKHGSEPMFGSTKASSWFNSLCFVCRQRECNFNILG